MSRNMFNSVKNNDQKSIEDLPNDVLLHLFSNFLDFKGKLEAEKVCKRWHQIANIGFATKRSLIIADYEIYENRIRTLSMCNKKVSVVQMISLHIRERTENKDKKFIAIILKKYKNLETLCICLKFTKCNSKLLDLVSQYCTQTLHYLRIEISECSVNNRTLIVSQEEVIQFSERIPELKYLYIDFVILFISEQSLQTIFTKWSKLEAFVLHMPCFRGCVYNSESENTLSSEFVGDYFGSVGDSLFKLELPANILNLNAITRIPGNTNLKRMLIYKLNINSMEKINQKFSSLVYFGFSIENNMNEDDMYLLFENIGKLYKLEELYFGIISGIAINYNCIKLLRKCKKLSGLQIDQTHISQDSVDAITKYLPQIQSLEIWTSGLNQNFHHCLNDNMICNIRKLKQLRKLNFRGQRNISDYSIAAIISSCPHLSYIDVRTTKAAIITLKACIDRSLQCLQSNQIIELFIHETPICRLFSNQFKRFEICKHLVLSNEQFHYKINF